MYWVIFVMGYLDYNQFLGFQIKRNVDSRGLVYDVLQWNKDYVGNWEIGYM